VTEHLTAAWTAQQVVDTFPDDSARLICSTIATASTQDRVRRHDGRNLSQNLATESLALHRQAAALAVSQPGTPPPQLLPKDAVLLNQIVDHVLLVAIDPSSEGQKQQPQG
jgi:hypothetical protein